eukprot:g19636.t1
MTASPEDLIGPSTTVTVPVVLEEVDGTEAPTDQDMDVMIVDFHIAVLESVRGFDPVTEGPGIQLFSPSGPDVLPESSSLLLAAYSWLEEGAEGRTQFYSAEAPPPASAAPAKSNPAGRGKTKASPGGASTPKRVTTATLAEQLAELSKNLPAISTRLDAMAERQNKVEALLSAGTAQQSAPTPAYRQNFERPSALRKASPLQFMQDIGSPPRVRALQDKAKPTAVTTMEEDEPELLPCDPDFQVVEASKGDLSAGMPEAIMRQSQALTTLVAHLVGQDSLQDFPSAASSSVLSLKGSAKRDKLLSDLSLRKGNFLLKVAQNAFRRLKPTDPLPRSLEEFGGKTIFSKYLERNGGYAGQKDLGLVMWLLCQIADTMIQGDQQGAQELLALTMVTIEQTALDGGKWEAKHDETSKQELAQRKVLQDAVEKGRSRPTSAPVRPSKLSPNQQAMLQERIRKMKEQEDAYKKQARTGEEAHSVQFASAWLGGTCASRKRFQDERRRELQHEEHQRWEHLRAVEVNAFQRPLLIEDFNYRPPRDGTSRMEPSEPALDSEDFDERLRAAVAGRWFKESDWGKKLKEMKETQRQMVFDWLVLDQDPSGTIARRSLLLY